MHFRAASEDPLSKILFRRSWFPCPAQVRPRTAEHRFPSALFSTTVFSGFLPCSVGYSNYNFLLSLRQIDASHPIAAPLPQPGLANLFTSSNELPVAGRGREPGGRNAMEKAFRLHTKKNSLAFVYFALCFLLSRRYRSRVFFQSISNWSTDKLFLSPRSLANGNNYGCLLLLLPWS